MEGEGERVKEGKRERGEEEGSWQKGRKDRKRKTNRPRWSRLSAGPAAAEMPEPDKMESRAGSRMSSVASQMLNESSKSRGKRKAPIPVVAECPVHSLISPFLAGVNGKDSRG